MPNVCAIIDKHRPDIEPLQQLYKHFHQNPELSNQEKETSASIFNELSDLKSFHIKSNIGGYGIAAVLSNGSGPTVLLRADFDALPVREDTGLVYASTKVMKNADGKEVSVAHACGHDMVRNFSLGIPACGRGGYWRTCHGQ
jgi:metal-dependent amidase/aminoacylase/carboxypeptidase family protein